MFKPGDTAVVIATGKFTKVVSVPRVSAGTAIVFSLGRFSPPSFPVLTEDGSFLESELRQGHVTVLANANPEDEDLAKQAREYHRAVEEDDEDPVVARAKRLLSAKGQEPADAALNPDPIDYALHSKVLHIFLETPPVDIDFNGHWKNGAACSEEFKKGILKRMFLFDLASNADARDLLEALTSKKALERWIRLGSIRTAFDEGCPYCGSKRGYVETNGLALRLTGDPCPLPKGFEPNEWELNVPSGRIVVANDLREWFPLPEGDDEIHSLNTIIGCRETAQAYAAVGLSHGFVSNTSPGVFKLSDGKFKISNEPEEAEDENERVSRICTDLWWYSLCDAEELDRRFVKFGGSFREGIYGARGEKEARGEVIHVKPGVYRFRHYDYYDRAEDDENTLHATFEWVRDPDPVKDFLKAWDSVDVNPHAYVQSQVKRWPTLYGDVKNSYRSDEKVTPWEEMTEKQRLSSWKRVGDHTFFTIGGGTEWHERGFPLARVDSTIPDIDPPSFREQNHWYPFAEGYGGIFHADLSPSFAKFAFRLLESVISFGMGVHDGQHSREVSYTRDRMLLAVKRYRELAEKYPAQADADYVWWLSQSGRAERWVEGFDLGPIYTEKHRQHAAAQRWVPDDAYAIEFDARKLQNGSFAWASGYLASKEDAERYAIEEWHDNEQKDPKQNCFWASHAKDTAVPLYFVARAVKVGEVSHMGATLVELAFDYGSDWMTNPAKRKAVNEAEEKDAIRVLTKEEYEKLLPAAKKFYTAKPKKKATTKKRVAAKKATKKKAK